MRRWQKIVLGIVVALAAAGGVLYYSAKRLAARFEPMLKEQAIAYLSQRFHADVQIDALRVRMPTASPLKLWLTKGVGMTAGVEGEGILLRQNGKKLFAMRQFGFDADLGQVLTPQKRIPLITLHGMEIYVPPKGQRPKLSGDPKPAGKKDEPAPQVYIDQIVITDATLVIEPKDPGKKPLQFDLQRIRLLGAGNNRPLRYEASLRNAKPPGQIECVGNFGPWVTEDPGSTPLDGDFTFSNANLGVFKAIDGILQSKGNFKGQLSVIAATGEATVPDFRLKMANNPVPLHVQYEVDVDGTNGDTILKPVRARLGSTNFTTSGAIIKKDGDARRTIDLDVKMPKGNLADLLRLAMKGPKPFMSGEFMLDTKIKIPPLDGKVKEKLMLDGKFEVINGKFLNSQIQDKIDGLSRKAQGEPKNEEIDEVLTDLRGAFVMEDEAITFNRLRFAIPGARLEIDGDYDLASEKLDFHGVARLRAHVSQTQTGWKRWALKPVDPFFAKNGAGTYLKIKITGDRKAPKFGLDRGGDKNKDKDPEPEGDASKKGR